MLLTISEKEFNEYLEENVKLNRTVDKAKLTKLRTTTQKQNVAVSFHPLSDQESSTDRHAEERDSIAFVNRGVRTIDYNNYEKSIYL